MHIVPINDECKTYKRALTYTHGHYSFKIPESLFRSFWSEILVKLLRCSNDFPQTICMLNGNVHQWLCTYAHTTVESHFRSCCCSPLVSLEIFQLCVCVFFFCSSFFYLTSVLHSVCPQTTSSAFLRAP